MWAYSFSKRNSITNAFLWKLWSFTESHFYRTLLCDCFWFPVTFAIYHLLYQQQISSVIASCLWLSEKRSACSENSSSKTEKTSSMATFCGWSSRDRQKDILQKKSSGLVFQKSCFRIFDKFYRKIPCTL